jgi:hypothetical protein
MSIVKTIYQRIVQRYPIVGAWRVNKLVFGNIRPLRINLKFWLYWHRCRKATGSSRKQSSARIKNLAGELRERGFLIFPPQTDGDLAASLNAKVADLMRSGRCTVGIGQEDWFIHVPDVMNTLPEITFLIQPDVVATIEEYFGSYFKIFTAEMYRIVPSQKPPDASGLWHTDNYPPGMVKIMVYLTGCDEKTGALKVHPWSTTRRLVRRGFFKRDHIAPYHDLLESHWVPIEGPAGTTLLWDSNIVHRATPPTSGIRDAVAFKFIPSMEPWEQHLARVGDGVNYERRPHVPADPAAD